MADKIIDRAFYDSIVHFDESDEAKEYYYSVMNTVTETDGTKDTVRNRILRDYSMLFCDELGTVPGQIAIEEDVEKTADRLYLGSTGFDPRHWYRMQHRFPVIDEDNYDRFAALVIADLNAGPLRDAAVNGGEVLLVGEADPLTMTEEERARQRFRRVEIGGTEG